MLEKIVEGFRHNEYRDRNFVIQPDYSTAHIVGKAVYLYFKPVFDLVNASKHPAKEAHRLYIKPVLDLYHRLTDTK